MSVNFYLFYIVIILLNVEGLALNDSNNIDTILFI